MKLARRYTKSGRNPLDEVNYVKRTSVISNPDGSEVFRMDEAEVPEAWSQLATDIVVSKYFRKRGVPKTGLETSAREVVHRVAHTIRQAGEDQGGYFDTRQDADTFEAELAYHLIHQMGAFNSPVWFNCGLYHEYGIKGREGHWYWDRKRDRVVEAKDSYSHPQCSACYIQSVDDDLESIFDLIKNEARLFKYGSGTGTNFSKIRGSMEKLSGGGTSSGLMSFLEVFDRGAGATKSGGTTRRAAKMVSLDMDHPEIVDFVTWKAREEKKVAALIAAGYSSDFNGDAYRTVGGQNSNNSIRIPDAFIEAYEADGDWATHLRTTGEVHETHRARDLMGIISEAAWCCADPGVQFDTTINKWHTCPNTDKIHGSNPCSEYMFLDDSACNLSSINLMAFLDDRNAFDIDGFTHACRIFFLAQDILVSFASYPTQLIAQNSHDYRPLGLGYANLGTLLMVLGLPYDSPEGRAICSAVTAVMCGQAYATSALMARDKDPFAGFETNREPMLEVIRMHREAVDEIDPAACPSDLLEAARAEWDQALELGEKHGYRNAQSTVVAPTGTIGLLMDCDTTGIEPDFALVKFKKLAGGGYFKIVNAAVPRALARLGYDQGQITDIITYVSGTLSLNGAPHINPESLMQKGLTEADLEAVEKALSGVFELSHALSPWTLGDKVMQRLGFSEDDCAAPGFCLLTSLGFSRSEVEQANDVICGRMTVEGAPHLQDEHLAIFDCANRCGRHGKRFIAPGAHLTMMAAAQRFISGAISKTVNVPTETTAEEIESLFLDGWRMGIKAVAIYRDGSKQSQPLSTSSGDAEDTESEDAGSDTVVLEDGAAVAPEPSQAVSTAAQDEPAGQAVKRDLPQKRMGFTQEARVAGHKVFLRTGEYEDESLGEIFIDMHKEGAPFRSMLNCFAIAVSKGLQHGVPLEEFVDTFTFTRFEPWGGVDHPNIKFATSVIDYVFRLLGYEYLGQTDFLQVKPEDLESDIDQATAEPKSESSATVQEAPSQTASPLADATRTEASSTATEVPPAAALDIPADPSGNGKRPDAGIRPTNGATAHHQEKLPDLQPKAMVLDEQLSNLMGDAPFCDVCGHITVRNGSCYKCLNCGNSVGCS